MKNNSIVLCCFILGVTVLLGCKNSVSIQAPDYTAFTNAQRQLILDGDTLTPMRIYDISNGSDSILLRTSSSAILIDSDNDILRHFVKRLYRTVRDSLAMGVGIAAPQVGILKNIIWVQRLDKEDTPFEVYLNPKINSYSDRKIPCKEGCLSIPNRRDTTKIRAYQVEIEYDQLDGRHKKEKVEGFTSVVFQHEIDHLNGILYIDHLIEETK